MLHGGRRSEASGPLNIRSRWVTRKPSPNAGLSFWNILTLWLSRAGLSGRPLPVLLQNPHGRYPHLGRGGPLFA